MKNKEQIAKIWDVLDSLNVDVLHNKQAIIKLENEREQPLLKQLDQSVFDGLDEKWRFAVMQSNGYVIVCNQKPFLSFGGSYWGWNGHNIGIGGGYDASNWQNSLIERESEELIGSDLCRAMINRGDKIVLCIVKDYEYEFDAYYDAITHCSRNHFESSLSTWQYAMPINNQGEPLTQAEAGL